MICKECKGQMVMHAFSFGKCEKCNCDVTTPHIPCNKICDECSYKFNLCEVCTCIITEDNK